MSSIQADTYMAVGTRAESQMAATLKVPIAMPNASFTPPLRGPGKRAPYLQFTFTPNGSVGGLDGLAQDGDQTYWGLLQIDAFWPAGEGLLKPMTLAGQVADWWPAGLWLVQGETNIRFDDAPRIAGTLQSSDLVQVPVTVRWRATRANP